MKWAPFLLCCQNRFLNDSFVRFCQTDSAFSPPPPSSLWYQPPGFPPLQQTVCGSGERNWAAGFRDETSSLSSFNGERLQVDSPATFYVRVCVFDKSTLAQARHHIWRVNAEEIFDLGEAALSKNNTAGYRKCFSSIGRHCHL